MEEAAARAPGNRAAAFVVRGSEWGGVVLMASDAHGVLAGAGHRFHNPDGASCVDTSRLLR